MTEFIMSLFGHWLMAQIPEPVHTLFAMVGVSVLILALLSLTWTTWTVRRILRQSLGRAAFGGGHIADWLDEKVH